MLTIMMVNWLSMAYTTMDDLPHWPFRPALRPWGRFWGTKQALTLRQKQQDHLAQSRPTLCQVGTKFLIVDMGVLSSPCCNSNKYPRIVRHNRWPSRGHNWWACFNPSILFEIHKGVPLIWPVLKWYMIAKYLWNNITWSTGAMVSLECCHVLVIPLKHLTDMDHRLYYLWPARGSSDLAWAEICSWMPLAQHDTDIRCLDASIVIVEVLSCLRYARTKSCIECRTTGNN